MDVLREFYCIKGNAKKKGRFSQFIYTKETFKIIILRMLEIEGDMIYYTQTLLFKLFKVLVRPCQEEWGGGGV